MAKKKKLKNKPLNKTKNNLSPQHHKLSPRLTYPSALKCASNLTFGKSTFLRTFHSRLIILSLSKTKICIMFLAPHQNKTLGERMYLKFRVAT